MKNEKQSEEVICHEQVGVTVTHQLASISLTMKQSNKAHH